MTELAIEIHVEEGIAFPVAADAIHTALRQVLAAEGADSARLSLAFVSDAAIACLNEQYLGHDYPTDVIAFPLHSAGEPPFGDLYVGVEQAGRQAAELGVPLEDELLRLAIHATLHLLGYDHPEGEERYTSLMYRRQEELLKEIRS